MTEIPCESVVLCEGVYDRAFWAGWLTHLDCKDLSQQPGKKARIIPTDPWGASIGRGQFAYRSTSGHFIRITPCDGKSNVLRRARLRLEERAEHSLRRLVINVDSDQNADGTPNETVEVSRQAVEATIRKMDRAVEITDDGDFALEDDVTLVSIVRWEAEDEGKPGLPNQQTLERLVCAALLAAYPKRGPCVQKWLNSRPEAPLPDPKEFAWSYMAGWYAKSSCDEFYQSLWRNSDAPVLGALESRLRAAGAWRIAEALSA